MELIKEIHEDDIGYKKSSNDILYKVRRAARAVLFNESNKVALLFVSKNNYHKLPGGGIEAGESIEKALRREVVEEVGYTIEIKEEIGSIIEYRDRFNQLQISYCFIAHTYENLGKTCYTEDEISHGFQLKWVTLKEAVEILSKDKPDDYMGRFIQKRDLLFLLKSSGDL